MRDKVWESGCLLIIHLSIRCAISLHLVQQVHFSNEEVHLALNAQCNSSLLHRASLLYQRGTRPAHCHHGLPSPCSLYQLSCCQLQRSASVYSHFSSYLCHSGGHTSCTGISRQYRGILQVSLLPWQHP